MKDKLIAHFDKHILEYGKVITKSFYHKPSEAHIKIEKMLLDDEKKQLNIIVPRGLGKTTLVGEIYVLWHLFVHKQDTPKLVVIVSKTQQHSKDRISRIQDIIEYSQNFRTLHGYHGRENAKVWREDRLTLDNGNTIVARGLGQPLRGLKINDVRPTLIVLDDPEDENNTKTSEAMEGNLTWLLAAALPSLDRRYSKIVIIGTPLNQRCLVMKLMDMGDWDSYKTSYIIEEDGVRKSIWEEMRSLESLDTLMASYKEIGRLSMFYKEYMCTVIGDEDQIFKPEYIQIEEYEYEEIGGFGFIKMGERTIPVNVFMGVDPASSTKQTADYSVIFPVAIDSEKNRYALPYFRQRVKPMQLTRAIVDWHKKYKPQRVRIETVGYQEMIRDYLREETYIPGMEIKENPRNSKSARLESLEPMFASKKVFLTADMQDFIDELLAYPRSKHDDLLDGWYYANKNVYIPYHEEQKHLTNTNNNSRLQLDWRIL